MTSAKLSPIADVLTIAWPASGSGSGTSRYDRTSGPPNDSKTRAFNGHLRAARYEPARGVGCWHTVGVSQATRPKRPRHSVRDTSPLRCPEDPLLGHPTRRDTPR